MNKREIKKAVNDTLALDPRVNELAKRNNIPVETLLKELQELIQKYPNQRLAVNMLMNKYRKTAQFQKIMSTKQKAEQIMGFLIGDLGMFDKAEQIRQKAKRYIEQNGVEAAKEEQLINEAGQVLDTREQIYGRPNPKYLEPLDPNLHIRSRTLLGFFKKPNSEEFKFTTIHTEDNILAKAWSNVKFFIPCTTFGLIKEDTEDEMKVNSSTAENTKTVFRPVKEDIEVDKIVMDYTSTHLTKISEIEQYHEQVKDAWDRRVIIRGIVSWVNIDKPTSYGSIWMGLMDSEDETVSVRCLIPDHLTIDFAEGSEVLVFGKTRRYKSRDEEGELVDADVIVDVHAIYPLVGLTIPRETGPKQVQEEPEISGWVE
jgi:hypothetical protein